MAAARKTTSTNNDTSTAKAEDTSTAKAEDTSTEATTAKASTTKADDTKASTSQAGATKESGGDKADGAEDLKPFVGDDRSTQERVDDPKVTNVIPAHYDPAVNAADEQASHAAQARVEDSKKAVRLQVRQFDTSEFGGNVLDALGTKDSKGKDEKK